MCIILKVKLSLCQISEDRMSNFSFIVHTVLSEISRLTCILYCLRSHDWRAYCTVWDLTIDVHTVLSEISRLTCILYCLRSHDSTEFITILFQYVVYQYVVFRKIYSLQFLFYFRSWRVRLQHKMLTTRRINMNVFKTINKEINTKTFKKFE
jgi:hypothetical protein